MTAVTGIGCLKWNPPAAGPVPPRWILVSAFENHTDDPRLGPALQLAFEQELMQSRGLSIVPRERLADTLTDAMRATLEREGIKYVENTQPGGRLQMLCNDPDGNTLEFQPATV